MKGWQVETEHGTRSVSPVYAYAFNAALGDVGFCKIVKLWATRDGARVGAYPAASWMDGRRMYL